MYPNPDMFYPERFLEKVDPAIARYRDPRNYVFGFGRRCVGVFISFISCIYKYTNLTLHVSSLIPPI